MQVRLVPGSSLVVTRNFDPTANEDVRLAHGTGATVAGIDELLAPLAAASNDPTGAAPAPAVPQALVDLLINHSEGNPYFMEEVVKKYGGGPFKVPPGGYFINIDRFTGARLPDNAGGDNVIAEYFRQGAEPVFGMEGMVDGGFGMGTDLPLFAPGETDSGTDEGTTVTTSKGEQKVVPKKAGFGSMTSGGTESILMSMLVNRERARQRGVEHRPQHEPARHAVVDDVGTVINPIGLKGQIHGGVAHGIGNAFFLYVRDPDGHRIEIYCSDYLTVDPDLEPIKWDLRDPQRQTLWGAPAPKSWFEEGTLFDGVAAREAVLKAQPIVAP